MRETPRTEAEDVSLDEHPRAALSEADRKIIAMFRALGQPTRFALWKSLGEKCQCLNVQGSYCLDMQRLSGLAQSTVSHHLKVLKEAGLVDCIEQGTWCCYFAKRQAYQAILELAAKMGT